MAKISTGTTKTQVRSNLRYARELIRQVEKMLGTDIADFSEAGDAGQLAMELGGAVATFQSYLDDRAREVQS